MVSQSIKGLAKDSLYRYMEIQEWCKTPHLTNPPASCPEKTAPDWCLLASRFLVAKLSGLLPLGKHYDDFLASSLAKQLSQSKGNGNPIAGVKKINAVWGKPSELGDFNGNILPAVIDWADLIGFGKLSGKVEFVQFRNNSSKADTLLGARVALVVGVDIHNTGGCDHYITVVKDSNGTIWAIDPWAPYSTPDSVVELPSNMSFLKPITAKLPAGSPNGRTGIPCRTPFFGHYTRDGKSISAVI